MIIPFIILFFIYPLIVFPFSVRNRYAIYDFAPGSDTQFDYYLLGKEWLLFILSALILILIVIYYRDKIRRSKLISLCVIALLFLLSALYSVNTDLSFTGANELFEPFPVLISYVIIFAGAGVLHYITDKEKKLRLLSFFIAAGAALISLVGAYQFITGKAVASTLYNPDYAGTYAALFLPGMLLFLAIKRKDRDRLYLAILISAVLTVLLLIFSGSAAGIMGAFLGTAVGISLLIFEGDRRKLTIILSAGLILFIFFTVFLWNNSYKAYEYHGFSLETGGEYAEFSYGGEKLFIRADYDDYGDAEFFILDGEGDSISYEGDPEKNTIVAELPEDSVFYGFHFNPIELKSGQRGFMVFCMDRQWYLGMDTKGNIHTLNAYGKAVDLKEAETAGIFKDREAFIHGRGYIWDRTLPLIKKHVLFGCGPDAFPAVFPQDDINKVLLSGLPYEDLVLKPHSLYLQIAVQLGLPLFILFIIFVLLTVLRSVKNSKGDIVTLVCLSSFVGFLTASLINDSTLCVTPLAAALMGFLWEHLFLTTSTGV